jgi:hypothetical protein
MVAERTRAVTGTRRALDGPSHSCSFQRMNTRTPRSRRAAPPPASHASLKFSPINGVLMLLGVAAVIVGYMLLARGSITAAPLLLVLGYAVLIPLAIIL